MKTKVCFPLNLFFIKRYIITLLAVSKHTFSRIYIYIYSPEASIYNRYTSKGVLAYCKQCNNKSFNEKKDFMESQLSSSLIYPTKLSECIYSFTCSSHAFLKAALLPPGVELWLFCEKRCHLSLEYDCL